MNKNIVILIVLLMFPLTATAEIIDTTAIGEDMVARGIDKFVTNTADSIMGFVATNETCNDTDLHGELDDDPLNSSECHGGDSNVQFTIENSMSVTDKIIAFASFTVTPFEYPSVLAIMGMSFMIGVGFLVAYLFTGAGNAMLSSRDYGTSAAFKSIMGSGTRDNSINNYGKNIIHGCFGVLFVVPIIQIVLWFSEALKYMMMSSIADSISPSLASISILYLSMAIMWLCLAFFFGISNMAICIVAAFSFIIGALYTSDRTRHITLWCADYFITMIMMQVFVIGITVVVVGTIMDFKTGKYGALLYILPGAEITLYIALILGLMYMCYRFTLGKTQILNLAAKAIRLVM